MTRRPLILIPACTDRRGVEFGDASCSLSDGYARAVVAAGGLPWVVPCLPEEGMVGEAVERCDGVMLTGGEDLGLGLHGDRRLPLRVRRTVKPEEPRRDWVELVVVREALRRRRPLLAICRGMQVLNVALGGSLVVDLRLQRPGGVNHHPRGGHDRLVHKVTLTPDSVVTKMAGTPWLAVNSSHHQAVERTARGLWATGVSPDGVVEVLERDPREAGLPWLVGVQFHPERLFEREPAHAALFHAFTRACRSKHGKTL